MSWPAFLWAAQRIMPMETETFSECLVPYCGISKEKSDASTASWDTPETSLPKIKAYFSPSCGRKESSDTDRTVCSTLIIVYPCCLSRPMTESVLSEYSHPTLNSAPRADLCISAEGGVAHIPHRYTLSTLKESAERNADPVVKNDDDAGFGGFPVLFGSHPSEFDIEKFSVACFHLCAISEKVINTKLRKNKKLTTFAVCVVLDLDLRNLINIYETRSSDFQSYQKRGRKAD